MKTVTAEDFESVVLKSDKPVLVDFYADWCGPCQALAPILEKIAADKAADLTIVKVDVDESSELAGKYHVRSMPTLLMFRDGEVIAKTMGSAPESQMKQWIKEALELPEGTVIDTAPKRVELSGDEKKRLTEAYRKAIDASPDADKPVTAPDGSSTTTMRQAFKAALESGEFIAQMEVAIGEQGVTVDQILEALEAQQESAPKP